MEVAATHVVCVFAHHCRSFQVGVSIAYGYASVEQRDVIFDRIAACGIPRAPVFHAAREMFAVKNVRPSEFVTDMELGLMTQAISQPVRYLPRRPATEHWGISKVPLKTQGEMEAAICRLITRFEQDYMGRGPSNVYARLIGDLLVVRLQGVLTAAEQQLVKSAAVRERSGPAQTSTDPSHRNGSAGFGRNDPGRHRRQDVKPAPRHQHRDR